jgi:hypothetical protein
MSSGILILIDPSVLWDSVQGVRGISLSNVADTRTYINQEANVWLQAIIAAASAVPNASVFSDYNPPQYPSNMSADVASSRAQSQVHS